MVEIAAINHNRVFQFLIEPFDVERGKLLKRHQILREAGTAVSDTGIEEAWPNSRICSNALANLLHVCSHGFTNRSDRVYEGDLHRQKCIGGMLDEFGTLSASDDEWGGNARSIRFWYRVASFIVIAIGQRCIDLAQHRRAALAVHPNYNAV